MTLSLKCLGAFLFVLFLCFCFGLCFYLCPRLCCSGCNNSRLGDLNNKTMRLTILEIGKSKPQLPAHLLLPGLYMADFSRCPYSWERGEGRGERRLFHTESLLCGLCILHTLNHRCFTKSNRSHYCPHFHSKK